MALPIANVSSLQWLPYNGDDRNSYAQYALDFTSYSAYTFASVGTLQGVVAQGNQSKTALGVAIDNTNNQNPVSVTVGKFVENIPPFTKSTVQLGGTSSPYVSIAGSGLNAGCLVTFYSGVYPGSIAQQNIYKSQSTANSMLLPPGSGALYFGLVGNVPSGWLLCDGSAVSRSNYAALFNAIGTSFGVGDGVSTFNLPMTEGLFPRGFDNGVGNDPGRVFGSLQAGQPGDHYHRTAHGTQQAGYPLASIDLVKLTDGTPAYGSDVITGPIYIANFSNSQASATAPFARTEDKARLSGSSENETRPANFTVNFMIKT